jgi:hypothetical protein
MQIKSHIGDSFRLNVTISGDKVWIAPCGLFGFVIVNGIEPHGYYTKDSWDRVMNLCGAQSS